MVLRTGWTVSWAWHPARAQTGPGTEGHQRGPDGGLARGCKSGPASSRDLVLDPR